MKLKSLYIGLGLFCMLNCSYAEDLSYKHTYRGWSGANYPASRCFASSFNSDTSCNSKDNITNSSCDYSKATILAYMKNRCQEEKALVNVTYHFEGTKLISIDGYFGKFNLNYDKKQWLKDIKYITPIFKGFENIEMHAYRVGSPLDNRLYVIKFDGQIPTLGSVKANTNRSFRIEEYVYKCSESSGSGSNCSVAEYHVLGK